MSGQDISYHCTTVEVIFLIIFFGKSMLFHQSEERPPLPHSFPSAGKKRGGGTGGKGNRQFSQLSFSLSHIFPWHAGRLNSQHKYTSVRACKRKLKGEKWAGADWYMWDFAGGGAKIKTNDASPSAQKVRSCLIFAHAHFFCFAVAGLMRTRAPPFPPPQKKRNMNVQHKRRKLNICLGNCRNFAGGERGDDWAVSFCGKRETF